MAQVEKKRTQITLFRKKKEKGLFFAAAHPDRDSFRVNEAWKTAE